jgi:hypothetical protein
VFSFIETKLFTRLVQEYLSDDEYSKLQWFLASDPGGGSDDSGDGRSEEAKMAGSGSRKAWRVSSDLLR